MSDLENFNGLERLYDYAAQERFKVIAECDALRSEVERLKAEKESWSEINTYVEKQNRLLKSKAEAYREALEKIAKPALGGKQQQWIAKSVLSRFGEDSRP